MIPAAPARAHSAPSPCLMVLSKAVPGLCLCGIVALAALGLGGLERDVTGRTWLSPLVLAILLGAVLRTIWSPEHRFAAGVALGSKFLLEVAVVLLGASVGGATLSALGLPMLGGVLVLVVAAIVAGFMIGRILGLPPKVALLIACGNAICGNSAIAAVAPVIQADPEDVAVSISFTAVLGVFVVLLLPLLGMLLSMTPASYGVLSGLTVYAVPQVLAAAAAFGPTAIQTGTVVKLVRVLMLGPVILMVSLLFRPLHSAQGRGPGLGRLLPWFIVGFAVLVCLRSAGWIPAPLLPSLAALSEGLTLVAMAALGLQTDLRALARAGFRTAGAVALSLAALVIFALGLITLTSA